MGSEDVLRESIKVESLISCFDLSLFSLSLSLSHRPYFVPLPPLFPSLQRLPSIKFVVIFNLILFDTLALVVSFSHELEAKGSQRELGRAEGSLEKSYGKPREADRG